MRHLSTCQTHQALSCVLLSYSLSENKPKHLQRLTMKPNPPAPEDLRGFQKRPRRKMKINNARRKFQNETAEGTTFSVPEYLHPDLHLCRGSAAPSPVEQFLTVLFVVCGAAVCGAAILPGFVVHLFSRHGVCNRPCGRRPRAARAGAFTFVDLKFYFCFFLNFCFWWY